ncbi:hypothetical protein ACFZAM_31320 [Streptomyces sp. NPDC008079]|uniref:hypothetical protein n=1 Tax=Streptomyces sp. NPDC008079 TaxID=3364806 RepID=UPI0036E2F14B
MTVNQWGSDVPVSMPQPLPSDLTGHTVAMGGFVMTERGLFHDLSSADHDRMSRPQFAPYNPQQHVNETTPDPADEVEHG